MTSGDVLGLGGAGAPAALLHRTPGLPEAQALLSYGDGDGRQWWPGRKRGQDESGGQDERAFGNCATEPGSGSGKPQLRPRQPHRRGHVEDTHGGSL